MLFNVLNTVFCWIRTTGDKIVCVNVFSNANLRVFRVCKRFLQRVMTSFKFLIFLIFVVIERFGGYISPGKPVMSTKEFLIFRKLEGCVEILTNQNDQRNRFYCNAVFSGTAELTVNFFSFISVAQKITKIAECK